MCFDWHVRGDCRSDECLWEYGGSERLLLVQQGLLRAAPTPVILLLALFLYFYCCDDYFCCYYGLFQGVLHRVQSESHECSGEATKGFLGCVRFPYCNLKMRSLIYWLTSRQICSWSRVANKIQWLSLWFSLYERNTEQLQVKMQTPPACCSPPSSIFHISFFLHFSSSVDGCSTWCTSPFWNMSLIEKTTSREMFALRTCTHSLIIQNWQTLCFPSYSKGNCSAEYSTEHSAVKIPVVWPLCWALTRE